MKQGEVAATLSTNRVQVTTNGDLHKLLFNLVSPPRAGNLYVEDQQVSSASLEINCVECY